MSYTAPLGNAVNFTTPGEAGYVAPSGNAVNFTSYGVPGFFCGGAYSLSGAAVATSGVSIVAGGEYALSGEAFAVQGVYVSAGGTYAATGQAVGLVTESIAGGGTYAMSGACSAFTTDYFVAGGNTPCQVQQLPHSPRRATPPRWAGATYSLVTHGRRLSGWATVVESTSSAWRQSLIRAA